MKTIGELRQIIQNNDGNLVIGKLHLSWKEGEDIDFHFDGRLIQWIQETVTDETLVTEAEASQSSDIERAFKAQRDVKNLELEKQELKKEVEKANMALGKVEAYEKLLIGRGVTISA